MFRKATKKDGARQNFQSAFQDITSGPLPFFVLLLRAYGNWKEFMELTCLTLFGPLPPSNLATSSQVMMELGMDTQWVEIFSN